MLNLNTDMLAIEAVKTDVSEQPCHSTNKNCTECPIVKHLQNIINQQQNAFQNLQSELAEKLAIIETLTDALRKTKQELFGRSSEKSRYLNKNTQSTESESQFESQSENQTEDNSENQTEKNVANVPAKKRGGQPGHKGHGRKIPNLPTIVVKRELSSEEIACSRCTGEYRETTMSEVSAEVDVKIEAVIIEHHRTIYVQTCHCEEVPAIIVAPKPPQIIYKSLYSNGFWAMFLVWKYFFQMPINRQINMWQMHNLELNPGTLIGGFKKLLAFIAPLYNKLIEISRTETHWHADETRWLVFAEVEGKTSFRWWLWVFVSDKVCVYVLDPSRSSKVPKAHFGNAEGIVNVDRYAGYHCLEEGERIQRALCWNHERRDFIDEFKGNPALKDWTESWVNAIAVLETINKNRISCSRPSNEFDQHQANLVAQLDTMHIKAETELKDPNLTKGQIKVLKSLLRNWEGLTVFAEHPQVPMHNNTAERSLRGCAVGRNNYYGHHAEWSGHLGAMCMSIFQTVAKYGLNVWEYTRYYFDTCAALERAPDDLEPFLPWNIPENIAIERNLRQPNRGKT